MYITAPVRTLHEATLAVLLGLGRSPPKVAMRDAASPKRNGAPLGRWQGWQFRSFWDLRLRQNKAGDYATTRVAPPFLGFRCPRGLRVGPAIATLA